MKSFKTSDNILKTIRPTEEQIETVVHNLASVRHLTKVEKIYDGKAIKSVESKDVIEKYNLRNLELNQQADRYIVYILSDVEDVNKSEIIKYNTSIKPKNYKKRNEAVIVIQDESFNKQHFLALPKLFYKIEPYVMDFAKKNPKDCIITIMTTYSISEKVSTHLDEHTFPINYRVISIINAYPMLGSKQGIKKFGFTRNYEVCEFQPYENNKRYAMVYDDDIMVKILNAMEGDLIACQVLINDSSPYYEWQIRQVYSIVHGNNLSDTSGLFIVEHDEKK